MRNNLLRTAFQTSAAVAVALVIGLLNSTASADIIFGSGTNPNTTVNIGGYDQTSPTTADGLTLVGSIHVLDAITDVDLTVPAAGAARIEADSTPFTEVIYKPVGFAWEVFEVNAIYAGTDSTFHFTVRDGNGVDWTSPDFILDAGNNRFWAQAINGQDIRKVTVTAADAAMSDLRQVRLNLSDTAIPEPSAFAFVGVLALCGIGIKTMKNRRKQKTA